jgi:putative ABC transport system permease protein
MLTNYLQIALRSFFKRKGSAYLNLLGLVIGISCCLLIFQYVSYERSYDRFETAASNTYRLRLDQFKEGKLEWQSATVYPAIGPTLKRDYPEVVNFCRLYNWSQVFNDPTSNVKFSETKGYVADPSAVSMLGVKLVNGSSFSEPYQMIVSETMARRYFGTTDAVGRRLVVRSGDAPANHPYTISGVFKDYPLNAHLVLNYLVSYASFESYMRAEGDTTNAVNTSFGWYDYYVYIQLRPGTNYKTFEAKLPAFCDKYMNAGGYSKVNKVRDDLFLIPLPDIHLYSNYLEEAETNGNGQAVAFLFMIGIFILGIAWINYINLSTARSVERAREVGVRKVLGALRSELIRQFLLESVLMNVIALVLSLVVAFAFAPSFNRLMGHSTSLTFHLSARYLLLFVTLFITGTLLSGLYPAFVLSGYKPIGVLKGAFKNTSGGMILRKGLIIFQFAISVILIAGTIIVYQQVSFMRHQNLGANISQTLVLNGAETVLDSIYPSLYHPFKNEVVHLPGVSGMTTSSRVMGQEIYWDHPARRLEPNSPQSTFYFMGVDYDFITQFQIPVVAGRNYSLDFPSDTHGKSVVLNEEGSKVMGFKSPSDAIGRKILNGGHDTLTVVGVVGNVHHLGLRRPIDPTMFLLTPGIRSDYSVKLNAVVDMPAVVAAIHKVWDKYFPGDPFNYFFLDDTYSQQYKSDAQFGKTFTLFSFLAIFIACLGLIGLSAYNILQRTKEIGVRKVLGASNFQLWRLLSKDFLWLVGISFFLAIPAAWWIMHDWLQDFAFRITISFWVFVVSGALAVFIALATISFQAIKAALANPIVSLRTE